MARCSTCHRRLRAHQPCPVHGGNVPTSTPVVALPFSWTEPVGGLLGAGGFAAVWELTGNRVIKVAHASHDLARARIAREAEALALVGPPAVPRTYVSGVLGDGRAYIVMARVAGETVADITADGVLRSTDVVALGVAICDALERVHAARIVHRDIKPDNLVRTESGQIVVLDLGLARKLPTDPDDPTRAHVQVGSLEYMAPEQIANSASVDERSDLYALGCVLFELLAGRPPFIGDAAALERAHSALRPPRLGAFAMVPAAVESVVTDCLAKEPGRRPANAAEVRERLAVARDERTPPRAMTPSVSVIREGKQPVVLLWAELPRVDRALLGMLTGRRLVVASQRGRRVLAGVLGGEHADPAGIAIAAARDLAFAGARVALHLDALRVSTVGGASTLHGASVDTPETWLPVGPWTGVVLTSPVANVTQIATRAFDALGPGFRALADEQQAIEVVGREGLLSDLVADAATALFGVAPPGDRPPPTGRARRATGAGLVGGMAVGRTRRDTAGMTPITASGRTRSETASGLQRMVYGPAFALLVGDAGVGKTTVASELARRLDHLGLRVHLGRIPIPGAGRPAYSALAPLVVTPEGPLVRAIGDALRAAARERPLAVILDDLHHADHDLLDALEYATLGGEPLPLWILGIAAPRLEARRQHLGVRAERHRRDVLQPLDEDAAVTLTAALLRPAEYPPLRALRRLVTIAHGNPLHLSMLARDIHQQGGVRARPGGAYFLDTTVLDSLAPVALGPWLAARELAGLGVELVALARLCAVLGGEVQRDELVAIVEVVERGGGATTTIDVDIGLGELVANGVLVRTEAGYRFGQALVEEGVYGTTNEDERLALHRAALEYWQTRSLEDAAEHMAHHADALEEGAIAARAYIALGERAHREHRSLDADQAWSGALRHLWTPEHSRAEALLGRARDRYRLQRVRDALVDLDEVLAIARMIADPRLELEAAIEQATAFDWADDYEASARMAAHARELLSRVDDVGFALEVELAEVRSLWRAQKFTEAEPRLESLRAGARAHGRHDAEIVGTLIHATVLVDLGRYSEASQVFEELIPLCSGRDDRLHLGAAYANRSWLWSVQGAIERCEEDLRRVIQLAREIGQASLERIATYNLAEALLWQGALDEALQLARRSESLQLAHGEGAAKLDQFLIARVLAAQDRRADLEAVLTILADTPLTPTEQATFDLLKCAATGAAGGAWEQALARGKDLLTVEGTLELGQLAVRREALSPSTLAELRSLQASHPLWSKLPAL